MLNLRVCTLDSWLHIAKLAKHDFILAINPLNLLLPHDMVESDLPRVELLVNNRGF